MKFNVFVDHELQREEAVSRLKNFSEKLKVDMPVDVSGVEEDWDDTGNMKFAFRAMGLSISGDMITCSERVTVSGKLPFAALPFRGAIESRLTEKLKEAIAGD